MQTICMECAKIFACAKTGPKWKVKHSKQLRACSETLHCFPCLFFILHIVPARHFVLFRFIPAYFPVYHLVQQRRCFYAVPLYTSIALQLFYANPCALTRTLLSARRERYHAMICVHCQSPKYHSLDVELTDRSMSTARVSCYVLQLLPHNLPSIIVSFSKADSR